jgi:predicted GNAT family acetyltransferase
VGSRVGRARASAQCPLGRLSGMSDVIHSPNISRFERGAAYLAYSRDGEALVVEHTVVPPDMEGQGVGGDLVKAAVSYAKEEGLAVDARCSFARGWLERHGDA